MPIYSVGEDPYKEGLSGLHSDESAVSESQGFDAQEDQVAAAAEAEAAGETRLQKTDEDVPQESVARRAAQQRKGGS